jgi:hypothetical protein
LLPRRCPGGESWESGALFQIPGENYRYRTPGDRDAYDVHGSMVIGCVWNVDGLKLIYAVVWLGSVNPRVVIRGLIDLLIRTHAIEELYLCPD